MNEITRPPRSQHATTQTADGLPRLKWTLAEFERLSELGFFGGIESERERIELVDGELLPMNAKGARHEWVRGELQNHLARQLPDGFRCYNEPGWRPGGDRYLEPEIIVCKAGFQPATVPPAEVLLLIEVADSSLLYDQGLKRKVYAKLCVAEYWVVNAKTLETTVYRDPQGESYGDIQAVSQEQTLTPSLLPALSVSLGALKLG